MLYNVHECECTLILLDKYGEPLINNYLKHMNYGLAFNDTMPDKEKQNEIFYAMKDEMRARDLKSKDIKKYIEHEDRRTDSGSCEKRQARGTRPDGLPLRATGLRLDCEAGG